VRTSDEPYHGLPEVKDNYVSWLISVDVQGIATCETLRAYFAEWA
jgi:hypothetical protein